MSRRQPDIGHRPVTLASVKGSLAEQPVRVEKSEDGKVHTVILHRPSTKNSVDRVTADLLLSAFRDFESDGKALAAVLYGEGGVFCSGADIKALFGEGEVFGQKQTVLKDGFGAEGNEFQEPVLHDPLQGAPMGPTRLALSKPVIAAISGHCVAGGLEVACWCDLRVCDETATFGFFCRRWGVPLVDGGTVRLPRLVGQSRALDMVLTGRPVEAAEAQRIGLVNRLVPKGSCVLEAAQALAAQIARFPEQGALRKDRQSVLEQWSLPSLQHALLNEYKLGSTVLKSGAQGAARFRDGEGRGGSFPDPKPSSRL